MRIWSLHPKYLDAKGLVALWRETLLAKKVLQGKTKGYKNHPQLERFKKSSKPLDSINFYLSVVHKEAENRNYNFDRKKINWNFNRVTLKVTTGQLHSEVKHLMKKLRKRDPKKFRKLKIVKSFKPHPFFKIVKGEVEDWEKF
jgi:hypothetical protein